MVSNRSRGTASVGNQLNQINSRLTQTENSAQTNIDANTITSTQIASDSITNDNITPGTIQADSIARGAIGTEHLGIVNQINTDSSLILNIGGATGAVQLAGGLYTLPTSGTKNLSLNSTGQIVASGYDATELDTAVSPLITSTTSSTRTALTSTTDVITTALLNGSSSTTRPAIKAAMTTDLALTFNAYGGLRVASLDALFNLMAPATRPPIGTIIHVGLCNFGSQSNSHFGSIWRVTPSGATAEPIPGSHVLMSNVTALGDLATYCKPGGQWNSRMTLDSTVSTAAIYSSQNGAPYRDIWMWKADNSGWFLHTGEGTYQLQFPGTVNHDTVESGDNRTTVMRNGMTGVLNLNINTGGNGLQQGGAIINVGPSFAAAGNQQFHFMVMIRNQGNNSFAWGDVYLSGQILIFYQVSAFGSNGPQGSIGGNTVLNGSLAYRATWG